MNKKLMAVAVASALAAPGLALAQSSVTISGYFKVGVDNYKVSDAAAGRAGAKNSENRVSDSASRIVFGVNEDLGGGLAAFGQVDIRFNPDSQTTAGTTTTQIGTGNTWVGLRSKDLGTVLVGRRDTHFTSTLSSTGRITEDAGALQSSACALMCYMMTPAGTVTGIAVVGRSANVVNYQSPSWSGFSFEATYSFNPGGPEADSTSVSRAGRAWNLMPRYQTSNWGVEWSHWDSKPDAPAAATTDQKADRLNAFFTMAGFRVSPSWDKSKLIQSIGATAGTVTNQRTAWTLPFSYRTGPHTGYLEITKARDDVKVAGDQSAKLVSFGYNYALSKRTQVAAVYSKLTNAAAGVYQSYSNTGGSGNAASTLAAGEDGRLMALTIKHLF